MKLKRRIATAVLCGTSLSAQPSLVHEAPKTRMLFLGPVIPVSPPGAGFHLVVNRGSSEPEGQVLMVCGERLSSVHNTSEGFVYASYDAGKTWQETMVEASSAWSSEHSCALGTGNRAYFIAGVSNTDAVRPRHSFGHVYLYSSNDEGRTWGSPTIGPFLDWTSMAVDRTRGANRGRIYIFSNNVSYGYGEWLGPRPDLLTSTDGGRTLTAPAFPTAPLTFMRNAAFPGDSVVLDDGTVVTVFLGSRSEGQGFASAASTPINRQNYLEMVRSTDGGRTVSAPIIVGTAPNTLKISLTIDRKSGTLYAAWGDEDHGRYRIMLSKSNDRGSTWSSTIAIGGDAEKRKVSVGDLALAVNSDGVLGLVWPAGEGTCSRFSVSVDQGHTFESPIDLNPCRSKPTLTVAGYSQNLQAAPFVDHAPGQKTNAEDRGVSIHIKNRSFVRTELLVDASGRFHPVWTEDSEGLTELWTRAITVGTATTPPLSTEHLTDISNLTHFRFSNNRFHPASATFYVDATLLNDSAGSICGPVRIVASQLHSDFGSPEIDNADNHVRGDGAIWDLTDDLEGGVLLPWGASMPRTLAFQIKNFVEKEQGNPAVVAFKVFGNTDAECDSRR